MKNSKFIQCLGGELEGGWKIKPKDLGTDNSIRTDEFYNSDYIGEVRSPAFEEKEDLFKFMEENWPTEVTQRCGYHIHFSLKNLLFYSQLMSEQFYLNYFLKEIKRWGEEYPCTNKNFWNRLEDGNIFCRKKFTPDVQVQLTIKNDVRYTHLNFCYGLHKTIECRLFPMFLEYQTGRSAVEVLLNCIEKYLNENPSREVIEIVDLLDENEIEENQILKPRLFNLFEYRLKSENETF